MSEDQSDKVLKWIRDTVAGSRDAKELLFLHFGRRLEATTRSMLRKFPRLKRWVDTNDVFQNAMIRLWKSIGKVEFQSEDHLLNLAALHIRQELLDLVRHYSRPMPLGGGHDSGIMRPVRDGKSEGRELADLRSDPDTLAAWTQFHENVAALPDEERRLVDMMWYLGLGQGETAKRLGTSESTVKRDWRAIKAKLGKDVILEE